MPVLSMDSFARTGRRDQSESAMAMSPASFTPSDPEQTSILDIYLGVYGGAPDRPVLVGMAAAPLHLAVRRLHRAALQLNTEEKLRARCSSMGILRSARKDLHDATRMCVKRAIVAVLRTRPGCHRRQSVWQWAYLGFDARLHHSLNTIVMLVLVANSARNQGPASGPRKVRLSLHPSSACPDFG